MEHKAIRYLFDDLAAAANGLIVVLKDARKNETPYKFGPLSARQILASGLRIEGDVEAVAAKLDGVAGAVRHDD